MSCSVRVSAALVIGVLAVMSSVAVAQQPNALNRSEAKEAAGACGVGSNAKGVLASDKPRRRSMVPTDLFSIRDYGVLRTSPDGEKVAVEVRSWAPGIGSENDAFRTINHRTELSVVSANGEKCQMIRSKRARSSQWNPVWSPNSRQLAFFSNEGQANAFLEIWNRASGHMRRLTTLGVDLDIGIGQTFAGSDDNQILWLDDDHLLAALLPEGSRSRFFDDIFNSVVIAGAGIQAAANGSRTTAIVASSPPVPTKLENLEQAQLIVFDTKTGASQAIGSIPVWLWKHYVVVSPNREWAAIIATIPPGPIDPTLKFSIREEIRTQLALVSLQGQTGARWVEELRPALVNGTNPTVSWKSSNTSFAIVGQQSSGEPIYVASVDVPSGKWHRVAVLGQHSYGSDEQREIFSDERIEILTIAWLRDDRMALRVNHPRSTNEALRETWWTVSGENATRLTPDEEALLKDGNVSDANEAVKLETSETGRLYSRDKQGHEKTILADLNPQLAEIVSPRLVNFEYKTAAGETLYANLLLPDDYVSGKRYPTIVSAYAGSIYSKDEKPPRLDDSAVLDSLMLTGRGFAVLSPSMPLTPAGTPGDPMLHLNDGVDPAVDRAIELGIVDPNRLAVMGASYGGYSVFGLLTQTSRYRAGISLMGVSDLATMYGEFNSHTRYAAPELAALLGPHFAEWEQTRMGVPPWIDPERYVRNSPFFAANKIITPLLIVSGDLDFLSSQSEMMFTALNRQGKRVEYVRYLGEAHGLQSPANILDMYERIFSWLDAYVTNAAPVQSN